MFNDYVNSQAFKLLLAQFTVFAVAVLGFLIHSHALINHDIAWLLVAAQRMLEGGSYSTDFFEVNMPLAIASYIPPFVLATALRLAPMTAICVYVVALSLQSAYLSVQVLSRGPRPVIGGVARPLLMAWILVGFLDLPGYEFGQREHLIAILVLPLICSLANVDGLLKMSPMLRCYIATLAGIGCYLKPHYAVLPVVLLGVVAWRRRSGALLGSFEAGTLVVVALINAAVVILMYPDWFTCARWANDLYGYYRTHHWTRFLEPDGLLASAACLALQIAAYYSLASQRARLAPFLAASLYACVVYLLQMKGWSYHILSARLLIFVTQGLLLTMLVSLLPGNWRIQLLAFASACCMVVLVNSAVRAIHKQPTASAIAPLARALATAKPGDSVYAFTAEVTPVFPAVPEFGLKWASRYSSLWPLLGLAKVEAGIDSSARDRLESQYRAPFINSVIEDFVRYSPDYVLVDRRSLDALPEDYDILSMFLSDPRFRTIWDRYKNIGTVSLSPTTLDYEVYRKLDP